jgi:hypothetical protein
MKIRTLARHPATWVAAFVVMVAFAVAMYLFQPWRLFTTVTVNEAAPVHPPARSSEQQAKGDGVIARGGFVSHEHETRGVAKVYAPADGERVLRIEDLRTSDGPDLRVWLSDQPVKEGRAGWFNLDDGAWVELGRLKGNEGSANYRIPDSADLDTLRSVTIWCKRFSVSFGAAALEPQPSK